MSAPFAGGFLQKILPRGGWIAVYFICSTVDPRFSFVIFQDLLFAGSSINFF
jgi:hypothetical protein